LLNNSTSKGQNFALFGPPVKGEEWTKCPSQNEGQSLPLQVEVLNFRYFSVSKPKRVKGDCYRKSKQICSFWR